MTSFYSRLILSIVSILSSVAAYCIETLPSAYDGTMTPYNFSSVQPRPVLPDSLRPVFINYIGRHGARFLSSETKVSTIEHALKYAARRGSLTVEGRRFKALLRDVREAIAGRWGALDTIGVNEQRRLAQEMKKMWPELFQSGYIEAKATYVPRVIESMYTFCQTLAEGNDALEIYTNAGPQNNALLRYFDTDSAYVSYITHGPWKEGYDAFLGRVAPTGPALRLVGKKSGMNETALQKLTMDIYGVLQGLRAIGLPAPTSEWMTRQEYQACWQVSNLKHYLQRAANRYSDIATVSALPLLRFMQSMADSVISSTLRGESPALRANLLFGHAETLLPLLSLMELPGCAPCYAHCLNSVAVARDFDNLYSLWDDGEICPLAANLEIVYLLSHTHKAYILIRLNGRNIAIRPYISSI